MARLKRVYVNNSVTYRKVLSAVDTKVEKSKDCIREKTNSTFAEIVKNHRRLNKRKSTLLQAPQTNKKDFTSNTIIDRHIFLGNTEKLEFEFCDRG